jgi:urease accessory protein
LNEETLVRAQVLPAFIVDAERIGRLSAQAIREDVSINLKSVFRLSSRYPKLGIIFIESAGDNPATTCWRWFVSVLA